MLSSTKSQTDHCGLGAFISVPREVCESCHSFSGPKFLTPDLKSTPDIYDSPNNLVCTLAESNIAYARSAMCRIDEELCRIKKFTDALSQRRELLEQFEMRERSLLSPIRKLPVELLQRILLQSQHEYFNDIKNGNWHAGQVASQVSSYFRSVSHSYPALWADIRSVKWPRHYISTVRWDSLFIEKCLRLSKETPLNIRNLPPYSAKKLGHSTVRALAHSACRWETLTTDSSQLFPALFAEVPSYMAFSALRELSLTGFRKLGGSIHIHSTPVLESLKVERVHFSGSMITLGSAPLLRRVALIDIRAPLKLLGTLPWSQIQHLTVIHMEISEVYSLLTRMPRLQYLRLQTWNTMLHQHIRLVHLETLELEDLHPSFNNLTAPSLRILQLGSTRNGGVSSLIQFIRSSRCSLEQLTFKIYGIGDFESWDVEEFASIKHLTLLCNPSTNWENTERIVAAHTSNGSILFPGLETLHLEGIGIPDDEETVVNDLTAMVSSRIQAKKSALKHVRITFREKLSTTLANLLKHFADSTKVEFPEVNFTIDYRV